MHNFSFPSTLNEAKALFRLYKTNDPLPEVPPALLNSGDIYDYARITGMIFPFSSNNKKLKSASYEIDFLGDVYWTDDGGNWQQKQIKAGEQFPLKRDSIVFICPEVYFQLPDYVAIRFNLKITCVHRGLLLGTGPLVDPGFHGRLLIPIHNLTSEDYSLFGGDGIIWVEFTKLSPHKKWCKSARENAGEFRSFPSGKEELTAQDYFKKASGGLPARSSIPEAIKTAKETAERTKSILKVFGAVGVFAIAGLMYQTWDLIQTASNNISSQSNLILDLRLANEELRTRMTHIEEQSKISQPKKGAQ